MRFCWKVKRFVRYRFAYAQIPNCSSNIIDINRLVRKHSIANGPPQKELRTTRRKTSAFSNKQYHWEIFVQLSEWKICQTEWNSTNVRVTRGDQTPKQNRWRWTYQSPPSWKTIMRVYSIFIQSGRLKHDQPAKQNGQNDWEQKRTTIHAWPWLHMMYFL